MRVVTSKVTGAWRQGKRLTVGNTRTDGRNIWLHGNCIARTTDSGSIEISTAGWPTSTTRDRLNGILRSLGIRAYVSQRDYALFYCDQPWDGGWMRVL
jgi:hypothetical protein